MLAGPSITSHPIVLIVHFAALLLMISSRSQSTETGSNTLQQLEHLIHQVRGYCYLRAHQRPRPIDGAVTKATTDLIGPSRSTIVKHQRQTYYRTSRIICWRFGTLQSSARGGHGCSIIRIKHAQSLMCTRTTVIPHK